ncbi:unnamed protein product [Penicillium discolor]
MTLLAFAKTLSIFIIVRLLQGGATAMVAVAGLALATDSFDKDRLGTAVGYLGSPSALDFILGPSPGGLIYTNFGYEAVFVIAAGLVGVDFIFRILLVEKKVMESCWIEADTESSDDDNQHITDNPNECSSANEGGFLLLNLIRQLRILITLWAFRVIGIIFSAFDTTLPIFVESTFHWSPVGAGLVFLPGGFSSLMGPYFGSICNHYGPRAMEFTGFIINVGLPALYVETQAVLDDMECKRPGIKGPKGAISQAFSLQTMAQFIGLFFGPL